MIFSNQKLYVTNTVDIDCYSFLTSGRKSVTKYRSESVTLLVIYSICVTSIRKPGAKYRSVGITLLDENSISDKMYQYHPKTSEPLKESTTLQNRKCCMLSLIKPAHGR